MKKTIVGLFLAVIAVGAALAAVTPKDIQLAVKAHDYAKAESLALEAVQANGKSAKAHYLYGETLALNGKHSDSHRELVKAKDIDPSLKFAGNKDVFNSLLAKEEMLISSKTTNFNTASPAANSNPFSYSTSAASAPQHAAAQNENGDSGAFGIIMAVILLGATGGGVAWFFKRRTEKAKEQAEQERVEKTAKAQLADMLAMSKKLKDAELECKVASYDTASKDKIIERIDTHYRKVLRAMDTLKKGVPVSEYEASSLLRDGETICRAAETGQLFEPAAKPAPEPSTARRDEYTAPRTPASPPPVVHTYSPTPGSGMHHSAHSAQPVIIDNSRNGGSDLLTGIMIGEMMSGHHDREVVREVRYVHDEPRREPVRETYRAPEPDPVFDIGSGSTNTFSTPSPDPEPTFDVGSGSTDSWSPSGNDNDTSSTTTSSSDDDNNW